jgi:glycine/D-amino acid oxidase-like deaminating enzyme
MRSLAPDQIFAPDFVAEPVWWADILATEALPRDLPTGSVRAGACNHARKGWFGFTFDRLPHMGLLQDGTHFAMGCNGSGVAMAAISATRLRSESWAGRIARARRGATIPHPRVLRTRVGVRTSDDKLELP